MSAELAIKADAVSAAPLTYLKDFSRTGYCMEACCVHLDLDGGNEPHEQFECEHGVWRFVERIYLTRAVEDSTEGWGFNIDGGATRYVQSGCDLYATLVCGDCGHETLIKDRFYGPLECEACGAEWARTCTWSVEPVPAGEVDNPLNVIEYRVLRGSLEELWSNGSIEFGLWDGELDSAEAKAVGRRYQAVVTDDVIEEFFTLDDTDEALAYWHSLVERAQASGDIERAVAKLEERESAERAADSSRAPRPAQLVRPVVFIQLPPSAPQTRESAFGRIVEGGAA